jgi:hypothetical protein
MCIPKNVGGMGAGALDEVELVGRAVWAEENSTSSKAARRMQEFFIVNVPARILPRPHRIALLFRHRACKFAAQIAYALKGLL